MSDGVRSQLTKERFQRKDVQHEWKQTTLANWSKQSEGFRSYPVHLNQNSVTHTEGESNSKSFPQIQLRTKQSPETMVPTPSKPLNRSKLIGAALPSTFSMIIRTKWRLFWIVLPLTAQYCTRLIRLGRTVCKLSAKISDIFELKFRIVKRSPYHVSSCEVTLQYPWWSVE